MERIPADPNIMPPVRLSLVHMPGRAIADLVPTWLPKRPLASHGDHLPTDTAQPPVQYPIIDDRQPRFEFVD